MAKSDPIELAYQLLRSFSLQDVEELHKAGIDERAIGLSLAEIARYPAKILPPPASVKERAWTIETIEGEVHVELPFFSEEEGISDLEMSVCGSDLAIGR